MRTRYGGGAPIASHFRTSSSRCARVRKRPASYVNRRYLRTYTSETRSRPHQFMRRRRIQRRNVMASVGATKQNGHTYKRIESPVGRLTLVASDRGLAAILWEHERPGRVRLNMVDEDGAHPMLVDAERQLEEYFEG